MAFMFNTATDNQTNHNHTGMSMHEEPVQDVEEEEEQDAEPPKRDYLKECELDYTPNVVRWMKANYLQQIKGEQHTLLVSGYNHCCNYLQAFMYGKSQRGNYIEVVADAQLTFDSQITDIQFADDQTAVIVTNSGEIKLIQLQQSDEYSPHSSHLRQSKYRVDDEEDDEKMASLNEEESVRHGGSSEPDNKWVLLPISGIENPCLCYPNEHNKQYPAVLTSVAVNTIRGQIVAADEGGYLYITDIDQQKSIASQCCSPSAINCIQFANNDTIASVSMSGQLMLWDTRDLRTVSYATTLPRKHGALMTLAVHPFRNHIFATGTEYGTVAIWDIRGGNSKKSNNNRVHQQRNPYKILHAHDKDTLVNDIKFLTNNANTINGLVTCGNDGIAQIFESEEDEWNANSTPIQEDRYAVTSVDFNEQLNVVITSCDSQKLSFLPI